MSELKQKMMFGHKVKSEKTITSCPNVQFGALYEASEELIDAYYSYGALDGENPIGFKRHPYSPLELKWRNLSKEDKAKLDGVLLSANFRNDAVKIIFFDNE